MSQDQTCTLFKKKNLAFLFLKFNKILVEDIDKTSSKIQSVIFTYFPSERNQVQNICRSIWEKDPLWKFQINNVYIVNLPLNGTHCPPPPPSWKREKDLDLHMHII